MVGIYVVLFYLCYIEEMFVKFKLYLKFLKESYNEEGNMVL